MKHGSDDAGGSMNFRHGKKVGQPGSGVTVDMQGTTSTRLPEDGAPRKHTGKGSKGRKAMAY